MSSKERQEIGSCLVSNRLDDAIEKWTIDLEVWNGPERLDDHDNS